MSRHLSFLKRVLVTIGGKPHYNRFVKTLSSLEKTQTDLLMDIVKSYSHTAFGKDHNFKSITDVEDFRKNVPVRDFEGHRPYINRVIAGESDILFPGRPISYNMTSGTTAQAKYIPVSKRFYKSFTQLNRLWFYSCLRDNPSIFSGRSLSAVSPAVEGYCEDGVAFGSLSGNSYLNVPAILKTTFTSPYPVLNIEDYGKKYYAMMRGAVACDVSYIICASPSNLIKLHNTVVDNIEDMIQDIREGTLRKDVLELIPEDERKKVSDYYKADPKRADELEKIYKEHGKDLKPKHYFPNLLVVNTWKQGNFKRIIPTIENLFSKKTAIRPMGFQASEARAGIVLENDWDFSLLAHTAYFYEFIDESERYSKNPSYKMLHELESGKRYFIFITNDSGLFRYDINDLIEVSGFYKGSPKIQFVQKGAGVTNVTGEKLSEQQILIAAEHASKKLKINIPFFMMHCDYEQMAYTKYVEFDGHATDQLKESFIQEFDTHLAEINPEYKVKRGTLRLDKPTLRELSPASHEAYKQELINRKLARDGQFKDLYLQSKGHVKEILEKLVR